MEMKLKSYKNFNEIHQHVGVCVCGGTPTVLVTELLHAVATIKYMFPQAMQNKPH